MTDPLNHDDAIAEGESLIQPLPEDNTTPFSPPDGTSSQPADPQSQSAVSDGTLDDTHQATDPASDIDSHQFYDEGLAGAAEASEPNAGNAVTGYDPEADSRRNAA